MAFKFIHMFNGRAEPLTLKWPVAANQTIARGVLTGLSAGKAALAAAGSTVVLGVAQSPLTTGGAPTSADVVDVIVSPDAVYEVDYQTGAKTSLTDADLGTAFDITAAGDKINLDDTVGGMCIVIGYDNVKKTAKVLVKSRAITA
jgi:hypothetical protein